MSKKGRELPKSIEQMRKEQAAKEAKDQAKGLDYAKKHAERADNENIGEPNNG